MAATTTPPINSLIKQLVAEHPHISFQPADDFMWSPASATVYFIAAESDMNAWTLLHETAHALLDHTGYDSDVELLLKEVDAWHYATDVLAPRHAVSISPAHIQSQLDTYRDWLHQRSLCPSCGQTGLYIKTNRYSCINCSGSWRVNDARRCALKRYTL